MQWTKYFLSANRAMPLMVSGLILTGLAVVAMMMVEPRSPFRRFSLWIAILAVGIYMYGRILYVFYQRQQKQKEKELI